MTDWVTISAEDYRKLIAYVNLEERGELVRVVRCKNCLRWKQDAYGGVCDRYGVRLDKDYFCAGGEKREVQGDN